MMEINHLPPELLLEVHRRLPPFALKKAVLVSKLWMKVGEEPSLWEWCKVTVYSKEDITNLAAGRLQRIQEIRINPDKWDAGDWEALLLASMELSRLLKIDGLDVSFRGYDSFRTIEPGLFARSLARLGDVCMSRSTFRQIEALFMEMSRGTRMKKIHLSYIDLSRMDPGQFARVLSRLEDVTLILNKATNNQIQALFEEILDQSCLKRIELFELSVHHLEPELFARALAKLEVVTLGLHGANDDITNDQIGALFNALSFGTHVKKLDLSGKDLSQIEQGQFSRALSRLEELSLYHCQITHDQLQVLFTEISLNTQLKKLHFTGINLSQLEPGLFSRVLARMEDVKLYVSNRLTTDQLVAFFTEASRSTRMKTLDTSSVNLSFLDPEVLTRAVVRLDAVTLNRSLITDDQVLSLFTGMSGNTQIKKLDIRWSDMSSVDPEVLATVLNRLDKVSLGQTDITHDQTLAFFSEMSRNTNLKKLDFDHRFSKDLDPEVLGTALTKLKEVNLTCSRLSTEQITAILAHVLEDGNKLRKLRLNYCNTQHVNPDIVRKVKEKLKGELWN